jgi:hypothetical protein
MGHCYKVTYPQVILEGIVQARLVVRKLAKELELQ